MNLEIIIVSTRPGRIGHKVGEWIESYARQHSHFDVHVSDLAKLNLPIFNEPNHPRLGEYVHDHTKKWSKLIDDADAVLIVTPEYNYTMPPSLVNAIDYLSREWQYKPAAFVGYGATGGVRAIQTAKLLLTNLSVMPIAQGVNMVGVHAGMGEFIIDEHYEGYEGYADTMLNELHKWASALKQLRKI